MVVLIEMSLQGRKTRIVSSSVCYLWKKKYRGFTCIVGTYLPYIRYVDIKNFAAAAALLVIIYQISRGKITYYMGGLTHSSARPDPPM